MLCWLQMTPPATKPTLRFKNTTSCVSNGRKRSESFRSRNGRQPRRRLMRVSTQATYGNHNTIAWSALGHEQPAFACDSRNVSDRLLACFTALIVHRDRLDQEAHDALVSAAQTCCNFTSNQENLRPHFIFEIGCLWFQTSVESAR